MSFSDFRKPPRFNTEKEKKTTPRRPTAGDASHSGLANLGGLTGQGSTKKKKNEHIQK